MMEGRGEVVRRTLSMPASHLLLLVPPDEVPAKTATLYGLLDPSPLQQWISPFQADGVYQEQRKTRRQAALQRV